MSTARPSENYNLRASAPGPLKLTVPAACAGLRLDQALAKLLPEYSRSRLAQWVRLSRATVNGRAVGEARLSDGDNIELGHAKLKFIARPA